MKRIAFSLLVATALVSAPAMAKNPLITDGAHRMHSYYYAGADRDMASVKPVGKLTKLDIKNVQRSLRAEGYKTGPIDGIFGWQTRSAVKAFQKDRNLLGKGKLTAKTLGALRVTVAQDFDHKLNRNYN